MEAHNRCRGSMCYICGETSKGKVISPRHEDFIKKFVFGAGEYSIDDIKTPNGKPNSLTNLPQGVYKLPP